MSDKRQDLINLQEVFVAMSKLSDGPVELISAVIDENRRLNAENAQLRARIEQLDTSLSNMASRAIRGGY